MNKWFVTAVTVLLAVSCSLKDTYTETNAQEFLNVKNGTLTNDNLITYNLKTDATDHTWKDCERIFALFDLSNNSSGSGYDIDLKSFAPVTIYEPVTATGEEPVGDPLYIAGVNISGGYLNMGLQWYTVSKSTANHQISMVFQDDPATLTWTLTVIHDADGETEAEIDEDDRKTVTAYYSVPIYKLMPSGETRTLNLTMTVYDSTDTEEPVKQRTITLSNNIRF